MTDMMGHHRNPFSMHLLISNWRHRYIDCGCIFLTQRGSSLNMTHCTFTSNNAPFGGAIYAEVRADNQQPSTSFDSFDDKFDIFTSIFAVLAVSCMTVATCFWGHILSSLRLDLSLGTQLGLI